MSRLQQRRGTAAAWISAGPTLAAGEFGYETDTGKLKIGDGTTAWASLPYSPLTGADAAAMRTALGLGTAAVVNTGTGSTNAILGNDSRLTDSRAPSGSAGGDLGGTYPNPTISGLALSKLATGLFPVGGHHIITPWIAAESASAGSWGHTRDPANISSAYYQNWNTGAQNDSLSWKVYLEAGTYKLNVLFVQLDSNGIQTWKVDGTSIGTLDGYAAAPAYDILGTLSGWTVASSAVVTLQMILATKHASSSAHNCELTSIAIVRTA